jgi:D-alanine-D-alanine ligase
MKIAVTYSTKEGLLKEFKKHNGDRFPDKDIPPDFFAEGDSPDTIKAVTEAIRSAGHNVVGVEANESIESLFGNFQPDLVFNMAEGLFGDFRESFVPMICERMGLPFTGSDPLTLGICLNKAKAKEILSYYLIPNAAFKVFYPNQEIYIESFDFPGIIKPVSEGSSKGIFDDSVVDSIPLARKKIREKMQKYHQAIILEKFLTGEEFTIAVWGNGDDVEVLPIVAIRYVNLPEGARPIYSYEAKWIWDTPDKPLEIFQCPAQISNIQKDRIEEVAKDAYSVLNIRDWCRIDIRFDENDIPHVLELNPLPGILPKPEDNSCFPKAARTAGYSYEEMINKVVEIAAKRYGLST